MRELFGEIWVSLSRNKLRTFLTGFSVAWGIFMLVVLLGAGNGLTNGVMNIFGDSNVHTISFGLEKTSMPYKGYQAGRTIRLQYDDIEMLEQELPQIKEAALRLQRAGVTIFSGQKHATATLIGITPNYTSLRGIKLIQGRFVNERDLEEKRKLIVIDENISKSLFSHSDPIGKEITIGSGVYTVIGIAKPERGNSSNCYLPITTLRMAYYAQWPYLHMAILSLEGVTTREASKDFEKKLREALALKRDFDPTDTKAIWVWSNLEQYLRFQEMMMGIALFIWIIGIGTLMAGIVGVSNIMVVTMRERTFEFGIRKALGASPRSIVRLLLAESLIITTFFGWLGLLLGTGLLELVNVVVERITVEKPDLQYMFQNPSVDFSIAVSATVVLILAGLIAGYVPARRAARLKTIDALRHNK